MALDIVAYASANMPDNDTSTAGGAIDLQRRVLFEQPASVGAIQVVATAGNTTQQVTVEARAENGQIVTDTRTLNGATAVNFTGFGTPSNAIARVLRITMNANASGNVTVRRTGGAGDIAVIPPGERGVVALFRKAFADPGDAKVYHEIIFVRNNDAALALLEASIVEQSDPGGNITFAVRTSTGGSPTITNRLTAPSSGFTAFGNGPISLADATGSPDLPNETAIAVCVRLSLAANNPSGNTLWTLRVVGQNT